MAYTCSNAIRDAIKELGRVASFEFACTDAGSTTTALNTNFNAVGKPQYRDGDKSLILGTLMVISTTDGLAPQGEYQRISAYVESTGTITVDSAFTAAIGANDVCMIIHNQFKIEELVAMLNGALIDLGQFYKIDTSLTTTSSRDYTLPIIAKGKRPVNIEIYVDSDNREPYNDYEYYGATAPGTEATIQFQKDPPSGKTLYVTYELEHPRVAAFGDVIWEDIPESLAKWGLVVKIIKWQNPDDNLAINELNSATRNYDIAFRTMKRWKPKRLPQWFVAK